MEAQTNFSLKNLNTFGIDARARVFREVETVAEVREILMDPVFNPGSTFILGGGSNVLFTSDLNLLVLKNSLKGIEIVEEDNEFAIVKSYGGEVWHDLVLYAINHNLGGIENLSLIPGLAGAAPMQNIGAYGVELKDVFESLEAISLSTGEISVFSKDDCQFGYRESIFKTRLRGQYLITSIRLRLSKKPELNLSYGTIKSTLEKMGIEEPTIKEVSQAVCAIRRAKLADPKKIGNAGSFFKNPVISSGKFVELKTRFPNIPNYPLEDGAVKIPAGWMVEECGWKGKKVGNTGAYKNQALVLVNYGGASGKEIKDLAGSIRDSVFDKFDVQLTPEVTIIGEDGNQIKL